MVFAWEGKSYDTAQMSQYETGDPAMPLICVTADAREVFAVAIARWKGVEVRRVPPEEVRALAERHKLPGLLKPLG